MLIAVAEEQRAASRAVTWVVLTVAAAAVMAVAGGFVIGQVIAQANDLPAPGRGPSTLTDWVWPGAAVMFLLVTLAAALLLGPRQQAAQPLPSLRLRWWSAALAAVVVLMGIQRLVRYHCGVETVMKDVHCLPGSTAPRFPLAELAAWVVAVCLCASVVAWHRRVGELRSWLAARTVLAASVAATCALVVVWSVGRIVGALVLSEFPGEHPTIDHLWAVVVTAPLGLAVGGVAAVLMLAAPAVVPARSSAAV